MSHFQNAGQEPFVPLPGLPALFVDYQGVNAYPENVATGYPSPGHFYFKMGLYRDVMTEPMTVYIDEYSKRQVPPADQPAGRSARPVQ